MLELNNVSSNITRIAAFQKILFSFILIYLFSLSANGQNYDLKPYEFEIEGEVLSNPMTGGFTGAQVNEIDLNMDGQPDLMVFDRRGDLARTFFHDGVPGSLNYRHDPFYEATLPPLMKFVKVADYNGDGVPDIFTAAASTGGISVYTGSWDGTRIRYSLYKNGNFQHDVLTVFAGNGNTQVYVGTLDVPEIVDVDNDGDLDVLSFEVGGSFLTYYKNMALENELGLDTFDFILGDFCWGKFAEGGTDGTIFLSDSVNSCSDGFLQDNSFDFDERHAGSTIESFDYECDGDLDLLIGDLVSPRLVLIINEPQNGVDFAVDHVAEFPENDPIDLYVFPSSWVLDIDHDGDLDIVACPNEDSGAINVKNFYLYENTGNGCNTEFEFKQDDFLNNTSIDLGTDSNPTFLDYNQDGLIDILVGTTGEHNETGQPEKVALVLFENNGDINTPRYTLVDDDYLDFSINTTFSENPTPATGDINGDGVDDLIVSDVAGDLYYFENTASLGETYTFAQAVYPYMNLDPGGSIHPYIYDYNQDGLGDIFLGEKGNNTNVNGLGSINYAQNMGTVGNAFFESNIDTLNNTPTFNYVNAVGASASSIYAAPVIFKAGERLLGLVGTDQGCIQLWELVEGDVDAPATKLSSCLGEIEEGTQTSLDIAEIDNDGFFEIVVGNKRGGLAIYNTIIQTNGTISHVEEEYDHRIDINLFPNPAYDILNIGTDLNLSNYKVLNIFGQVIEQSVLKDNQVPIYQLPSGVYFISFEVERQQVIKKFIKA